MRGLYDIYYLYFTKKKQKTQAEAIADLILRFENGYFDKMTITDMAKRWGWSDRKVSYFVADLLKQGFDVKSLWKNKKVAESKKNE